MSAELKRQDRMASVGLIISVVGTILSILASLYPQYILRFLQKGLSALVNGLIATLAIAGALLVLRSAGRAPRNFQRYSLIFVSLAAWAAVGVLLTITFYRPTPLVLVGSSNVRAYLEGRLSLNKRSPFWADVPSDDALAVLFHAFDYGKNTGAPDRMALIALSSHGTGALRRLFNAADQDERTNNHWLSIKLGTPPLTVFYRSSGNSTGQKPPRVTDSNTKSHGWVSCEDIKDFFEKAATDPLSRIAPEPSTGTRGALTEACGKIDWQPSDKDTSSKPPAQCMEHNQGPFVGVASVPMYSCETDLPASCDDLAEKLKISFAPICKGPSCGDGRDFARADLVVVMKMKFEQDKQRYRITNPVECRIAQELTSQFSDCQLPQSVETRDNIAEVEGIGPSPVPDYGHCPF